LFYTHHYWDSIAHQIEINLFNRKTRWHTLSLYFSPF
jgi:hypothetical protein